jgi:hypothetical protein
MWRVEGEPFEGPVAPVGGNNGKNFEIKSTDLIGN